MADKNKIDDVFRKALANYEAPSSSGDWVAFQKYSLAQTKVLWFAKIFSLNVYSIIAAIAIIAGSVMFYLWPFNEAKESTKTINSSKNSNSDKITIATKSLNSDANISKSTDNILALNTNTHKGETKTLAAHLASSVDNMANNKNNVIIAKAKIDKNTIEELKKEAKTTAKDNKEIAKAQKKDAKIAEINAEKTTNELSKPLPSPTTEKAKEPIAAALAPAPLPAPIAATANGPASGFYQSGVFTNPSAIAHQQGYNAYAVYQNQNPKLGQGPIATTIGFNAQPKKLAVGVSYTYYQEAVTSANAVNIATAYKINITEKDAVSIGVSVDAAKRTADLSLLSSSDIISTSSTLSSNYIAINSGAWYKRADFYLGASVLNINRPNIAFIGTSKLPMTLFVHSGYSFNLSSKLALQPSIILVQNLPLTITNVGYWASAILTLIV
jgi:type IX secretion system PorP/SprF family membrane protein